MKKYIILILLSIFVTACGNKQAPEQENKSNETSVELTDAQYKNAGIQLQAIEKKSISCVLKVNGEIDVPPQNMLSISAPLGGYLKSTTLLPGMHINKGESIALMEDPQYITLQQEYLTAKTKLVYLQNEFNRQESLNKSAAASDKILQEASMNFYSQKVLVKSLSEKLLLIGINPDQLNETTISRTISIHSPIDGYVSKVNFNIGKYANPTDILFELVNPKDIHLALTVFEKDLAGLEIGQKLIAYTNAQPDKKYPCEIILIGKDLSQDRCVEVHCHFEEYEHSLIPGMFMNAEIEVSSKEDYAMPDESIVTFEGKQFVFVERENKSFDMIEVKTGNSEHGWTQVKFNEGFLPTGKLFAVKGAYNLLMKLKNNEE
ncbi:MAG: efflux RND transporter periplasmic adaptor subunit [Bacteroidota bacterium]